MRQLSRRTLDAGPAHRRHLAGHLEKRQAQPHLARRSPDVSVSRRALLGGAPCSAPRGLALAGPASAPLVRSGTPLLSHGVQSDDGGTSSATVWTRADRASRR
jgi:hypothetical protein